MASTLDIPETDFTCVLNNLWHEDKNRKVSQLEYQDDDVHPFEGLIKEDTIQERSRLVWRNGPLIDQVTSLAIEVIAWCKDAVVCFLGISKLLRCFAYFTNYIYEHKIIS